MSETPPITRADVEKYYGEKFGDAAKRLGVKPNKLRQLIKEYGLQYWPKPKQFQALQGLVKRIMVCVCVGVVLLLTMMYGHCSMCNLTGWQGQQSS